MLRCDNGSNFLGAERELLKEYSYLDQSKIQAYLAEETCEWIEWKFNAPYASHTGGVWERLIRTSVCTHYSLTLSCLRNFQK